jgi:DHA2 family multidrug resistance protein-like MFS transporter
MVPQMVSMAIGMNVAPLLARRIRPGRLMAVGLLVAALGMLVQVYVDTFGIAAVVVGLTLTGLGITPAMALTTNLLMGSAEPSKAGSAAALAETSGEFGVAMGVATLGSVAAAAYRSHLSLPWDMPADAGTAARQGITEAIGAARNLPASVAGDLVEAARSAFTAGMSTVAVVGTVVFAGLAVLVAVAFRDVPATSSASVDDEVDFVSTNAS